jgi:Fe-S oxidoreductase
VRQIVQEVRGHFKSAETDSSIAMGRRPYRTWIKLAYRVGHVLWREYGWKWLSLPLPAGGHYSGSYVRKSKRSVMGESILAVCCVQDLLQHELIDQTLALIERLGSSIAVDRRQPCCGAIFERLIHGGEESIAHPRDQQKARSMQEKSREAFKEWMSSKTYFLSKGCQCFVERNSQTAGDLYGWIESIMMEQQVAFRLPHPREVYYQPYCGLSGQYSKDPVRRVLSRVENLILRDIPYPSSCCGGYCGEFLLHPMQSEQIAKTKLCGLPEGATIIVTSSDCWGQFKMHSGEGNYEVLHPVQILAEAQLFNNREYSATGR